MKDIWCMGEIMYLKSLYEAEYLLNLIDFTIKLCFVTSNN